MTRILHLTASTFLGGPERQMLGLAEALIPFGIRSAFLSFREDGRCQPFIEEAQRKKFIAKSVTSDWPHLSGAIREVIQDLRELDADVLLPHGYKSNIIGLAAARCIRMPVVSVAHGWTGESWRVRRYEALDRRVLRLVDRVVAVSEAQATRVQRAGVPESRIVVIRDAVDPSRFSAQAPGRRTEMEGWFASGTKPQLLIGAAGRLSPEKGFDLLLEAAAQVARYEPSVGFILFGDGALRRELQEQAVQLDLSERFVFAGFRANVEQFFPYLDMFVQSSHTEGLPNVVLEAMASSIPVIATAVGGTPEVVVNNVSGLLVSPANSAQLFDAILSLTNDCSRRTAMGQAGRDRVLLDFSFVDQAKRYLTLLHSFGYPGETVGVGSERDEG